jgi:hypothetical protein
MSPAPKRHAVPGGTSALKPPAAPARDLAPPPNRPPAPGSPEDAPATSVTAAAAADVPAPPPAARRHPREQLNSKIRVDLRTRLNAFVERHDSTLQGVLEAALDEYMARRGWSWDDYHHAQRRG